MSKLKRLQHKQRKRRAKDETFVVRLKKKDVEAQVVAWPPSADILRLAKRAAACRDKPVDVDAWAARLANDVKDAND